MTEKSDTRASGKRASVGVSNLDCYPRLVEIEKREGETRIFRITVEASDQSQCTYVQEGHGLDRATAWLARLAEYVPQFYQYNEPLFINGMAKTGKTSWLREVVPSLIRSSPFFGESSEKPALILSLDCRECQSPFDFFRVLHDSFLDAIEPYVSIPSGLEEIPSGGSDLVPLIGNLYYIQRYISRELSRHVFLLIDDVETWFATGDGLVESRVSRTLQIVFKNFAANTQAPFVHCVMTGSCMAQAWINIGTLTRTCVHLSAQVSDAAFSEAIVAVKGRYSDVDNDLLKMIAVHADKNPALLAFLVEESRRVEICSRDLSKVSEFCATVIAQRMTVEFGREMKSFFARMPPDNRRNLRRLFNRRTGISRLELGVIGRGWPLYVGPFTTPLSHGDSSRSGYVYVDPAEELIYLESLPFEALLHPL